jgi:hypothetical protein
MSNREKQISLLLFLDGEFVTGCTSGTNTQHKGVGVLALQYGYTSRRLAKKLILKLHV